jgi:DHA1 family bicyclomycin/chloramphenicol resistance-like MFS transporter
MLALLSMLSSYSIDAFFPSMRAITAGFGVDAWQGQQLLTAYLVPHACMAMLHGALSDAWGRRRVLLVGLLAYVAATMGCALAPTFGVLLLMRALQGMVVGVGVIVGRAIVRDCYSGAQAQRVMSTISITFCLGPAVGPTVGGWVQLALGWRAVFTTMALAGALLAWMVARRLPETLPRAQRVQAHPLHIAANIARVCRHREFLLLATGSSLVWLAPQLWMGAAPAVILDHWHGTETSFAQLTFPVIVGYMLGALISGRLAGHWPPGRQAVAGYVLLSCGAALMLLLQVAVPGLPVLVQQALLALTTLGLQMLYPVVMLRVIDLFPGTRGAAASALSGFTIMASALGMGLASPWLSVSLPRLSAGACACVATSLALWWPVRPRGAAWAALPPAQRPP